jgi:MerR family transcriptional regulator, light-induced transcriptional regulator
MADDRAALRIGEVARRTGVAVATLRAWERRYDLLDPERTDGGHRLYSDADVGRVSAMRRLLDEGWQAGAAAREVLRAPAPVTPLTPVPGGGDAAGDLAARLRAAIDAFDAAGADHAVDDVFARLEIPRALDEVVLPVLREVGDGWEDDPRIIAREHFATNTLRPRLQRLLRVGQRAGQRTCVAAAPEHEDHDLGLLAAAVSAVDGGWRVHFLGARTPTRALERSVVELAPHAVLVGSLFREHAEAFLDDRPTLGSCAVVLGGGGFAADDVSRLPHAVLHQGTMGTVAQTLDRALAARTGTA